MAVASTVLSRIQIQDRTPGTGLGSDPSLGKNSNFRGNEIVKSSSSNNILTGGKKDKTRLIVTVAIGANGIGLVVTDDESSNYIIRHFSQIFYDKSEKGTVAAVNNRTIFLIYLHFL